MTSMTAKINRTISNYFASQPVVKAWVFGSYSRGEVDLVTESSILPFAKENAERDRLLVYERDN